MIKLLYLEYHPEYFDVGTVLSKKNSDTRIIQVSE